MLAWAAGQASRRAVNARSSGKLPPLARAVALAAMHGVYGVTRIGGAAGRGTNATPTYDDLAATLGRLTGVPVTKTDIKHVKHRGGDPEKLAGGVAYLTSADIEFAINLMVSGLSAIDCLTELCGGESAALQLADAYRQACNTLGGEEAEPSPDTFPEPAASIPASALKFISSEFPDDAEALSGGEKDALEGETDPERQDENKCRILAFDPENAHRSNFCELIKTPVQDLRHPDLISVAYQGAGGAKPPPPKELVPQAPINAIGNYGTNSLKTPPGPPPTRLWRARPRRTRRLPKSPASIQNPKPPCRPPAPTSASRRPARGRVSSLWRRWSTSPGPRSGRRALSA